MPRIRTIKPEFFLDYELSKLNPVSRLFYIGLWCHADKKGRLKNEPEKLKVQILPWEKTDVLSLLMDLSPKWVTCYENEHGRFLQIRNWEIHQRPHHTEPESTIKGHKDGEETVVTPSAHGDCLVGKEGKGRESVHPHVYQFDAVWADYPSRVGKKQAERHFKTTVKTQEDYDNIKKALANYKASDRVAKGFVQNGSTWFNNWHDWVDVSPAKAKAWNEI